MSELPRSGCVRGVAALRRQVSIKRPNGALSVSSRSGTTKRQIRSVGFVQGLRAKRSPDRPFGEQLPFDSSTVAERCRFEIVNPTASDAPTLELEVRASFPTPTASRGSELHSPFFVQCKGKGVNGQRRREPHAAGANVGHLSLSPPYGPMEFAGWFEPSLGGPWYTFDPRNNRPRIGRVLIALGRDAADVPMRHTFGPNTLFSFKVWTDEVS